MLLLSRFCRVDLLVLGLGQLSAVGLTVVTNLAIEIGFAALDLLGFAGGQLPRVDAVGDPVLLVLTTVVDGRRIDRLREPDGLLATITRFVFIMSSMFSGFVRRRFPALYSDRTRKREESFRVRR